VALAGAYRPAFVILGRSTPPGDEPGWLSPLTNDVEIKQAILRHEFANRTNPTPAELKSSFDRYMAAREIRRNLARIAENGAAVQYECVDVRDANAVTSVVENVRQRHGSIRGVIHAAGVLEDRLIADKTIEQFDRVFDTKVAGLRNLLDAVNASELRHLVLFSSVSARFGNAGQADYAMANEVLNKTARQLARRLPNCRVASINWGPWDGGMVNASLRREFSQRGVELIPLEAGARCLVEELAGNDRPVEVILGGELTAEHLPVPIRRRPARDETDIHVAFERRLDLARHDFLRSHVIGGHPVLPAAMMMEWLAHAALHGNPGLTLHGIDDFHVLKGVILKDGPITLRFVTSKARRSGDLFEIDVAMQSVDSEDAIPRAKATVVLATRLPVAPSTTFDPSLAERAYARTKDEIYADALFHGEHLEGITAIRGCGPRGLIADLATAPSPREWMADPLRSAWLTDPLALDAAFQAAIVWCREEMGAPSLPSRLGRYRQYRGMFPAEGVTLALEVRRASAHSVAADLGFFDAAGGLVAKIEGYECTVDASLIPAFQRRAVAGAVS
jgi:NAD(P)-dependent dehydrogenase (short-subunit alcohol dehydrogenase family)